MTTTSPMPAEMQLDVTEVMAELGRVHAEIAATGSTPVASELAQSRLLIRKLHARVAELEQAVRDASAPPAPDA